MDTGVGFFDFPHGGGRLPLSGRSLLRLPSWQTLLPAPLISDNEHHSSIMTIREGALPAAVLVRPLGRSWCQHYLGIG
jgi:hypothetical protein